MIRFLTAAAFAAWVCLLPAAEASAAPATIAMVAGGSAQPFWQVMLLGARKAAADYRVDLHFQGPESGTADEQVGLVDAAIAAKPSALCVDALDRERLLPLLQAARRAGIPVIAFHHALDDPLVACTAATDNAAAGAMAAAKLAAFVGGRGTVGIILRDQTSREGQGRRDGFLHEMRRHHPGITVLPPKYSGGDQLAAAVFARILIQAETDLKGIFAGDEDSAAGVLRAVRQQGLARRLVVVGFDSGSTQLEAIRSGIEAGAVTRDPFRIGYKAVEAAVQVLNGQRVPRWIDTGFHWWDRSNLDDPAIAILLHPSSRASLPGQ